ncbi:sodium:proton antiporter [Euryarchaeota archaeon ex4484_178]|nr:MAG: sodium:proton antiporter [Euryarchaeota archaeon ex4484_178]
MIPTPTFEFGVETIALAMMIIFLSGIVAMLVSKKTKFPYTPLLIFLGILVGPILGLILPNTARVLFYYVRAFGLFIVMFAAGFQINLKLLRKHMMVIALLDTLGLFITALIAGWFFELFFQVPWSVGFLFGAIVSGTDPATLVPLFKEQKISKDMETIIITESIFNGPLAIILTMVALIIVLPEISAAEEFISFTPGASVYMAAIFYFLYQIFASALIGAGIALLAYWSIKKFKIHTTPFTEVLGLGFAFGAYVLGEALYASGFLVVTILALILGNHKAFFKKSSNDVDDAVKRNMSFNDTLSTFSIILIFVLLGASLNTLDISQGVIISSIIIALLVVFVARPLATLIILPKVGAKKYTFIALEGPKGAVAASMATLPVALGKLFNDANMIHWGEFILTATLMTVFLSMILESAWMKYLKKKLLEH